MNMAYGTKIESDHDPWIRWMRKCLARLGESFRPGYWKVDIYPFLQYALYYIMKAYTDITLRLSGTSLDI